ncbi:ABC transporter permease [Anaerocolumna sp. AGMB13025]|uniref:ABC transporter permease n=1 Tax=Anaerocolumna sp. AGMB13025 TaxID=3039116 RepID=UPI00241CFEE7|nr:ABC transporter permease [Anaerocolumna sp. AGMB13025]WFR58509.1 ABC transporter permease [Anaerocolumna sp. AGMB13025]
MISLLKLEFKKFNIWRYGISFLIITAAILSLTVLIGAVELDEDTMVTSSQELMAISDIFIRLTFTIVSGVLISKLIISEFKNSTIKIMFTYPISRKKIIGAKLIIIWTLIFTAIILENLLIAAGLKIIDSSSSVLPIPITYSDITARIPVILYSALINAGLSLIPLYFGMRKKSTTTTIVASVIVSFLINGSINGQETSLYTITVIPVLLCLSGVLIAFISYCNIEKTDIN